MERLKEIPLGSKKAIFLNFRESNVDTIFFREILHRTTDILQKRDEPQKILADFTGISYTHKYCEIAREFIAENPGKIKAAAFTGIHLEQEIDPQIIQKASEQNILFFTDINEAKNWLSSK